MGRPTPWSIGWRCSRTHADGSKLLSKKRMPISLVAILLILLCSRLLAASQNLRDRPAAPRAGRCSRRLSHLGYSIPIYSQKIDPTSSDVRISACDVWLTVRLSDAIYDVGLGIAIDLGTGCWDTAYVYAKFRDATGSLTNISHCGHPSNTPPSPNAQTNLYTRELVSEPVP